MKSVIVGCGNIAQVHAKVIEQVNPGGLAAAVDCRRERAEELAERYGAAAYESLEEALERERPDIVHICTPHYLHVPMAVTALRQGVSVFLEKPPAISPEQWRQLREEAGKAREKGSAQLGLCFQNRYNGNVRYVRQKLAQGEYGRILGARGIVTWNRDYGYYQGSDWKGRIDREGGGVLINQAVHTLDLIQYLVDERPDAVEAVMDNQHLRGLTEVEDTMAVYIRYPLARACLYAANSYVSDVPPLLELECEKARVRLEDISVTVWDKETGERSEQEFPAIGEGYGKSYWGAGHLQAIREFYDCVRSGTPYSMNEKTMEDTVLLMLEAYQCARKRNDNV